jgi:hypothetical protein
MNKTERLLKSFKSVELLPEHRNYGDETPCLRDYGIAGKTATTLIRWGETECLVCTFESARGVSNNTYSWKPQFIKAAVNKHIELFGDVGKSDLTPKLLNLVSEKDF